MVIYEVLYDGPGEGPAGDGTRVARFRKRRDAEKFAAANTCWGRPCTIGECKDPPARLLARWGI